MKAGVIAASLLSLAAAQPHRQHLHLHERDLTVVTVTQEAPDVIVMVDQFGNMIGTKGAQAEATPAPAAAAEVHVQAAPAAEATPAVPVRQSAPVVKSNAEGAGSMSGAASGSLGGSAHGSIKGDASGSISGNGVGITYTPYLNNNNCKSQEDVLQDFEVIKGYSSVRFYDVNCDQAKHISVAARKHGMKMMAGLFYLNNIEADCKTLHADLGGDWSDITAVSIGNELVQQGTSAEDMAASVAHARSELRNLGYTGPVVSVETFNSYTDNHANAATLCQANDFVAINAHSWFDLTSPASNTAAWTKQTIENVQNSLPESCKDKKVVVTEAGFPRGTSLNLGSLISTTLNVLQQKRVPQATPSDQSVAISQLTDNFDSNFFLFNAFNDEWKMNAAGVFGVEPYWGIHGDAPSCNNAS